MRLIAVPIAFVAATQASPRSSPSPELDRAGQRRIVTGSVTSTGSRTGMRSRQLQVDAQCVVDVRHDVYGGSAEDGAKLLDCDRADLLGLGSGVLP